MLLSSKLKINVNSIFQVPGAPLKELFGFQKVYLDPGMSETLVFSVGPQVFETVDKKVEKDRLENTTNHLYQNVLNFFNRVYVK